MKGRTEICKEKD